MASTGLSLEGKRVVVIGGASGIGFAVAKLAHEAGAAVVIGSIGQDKIDQAVKQIEGAKGIQIDVRDESSVERFFASIGSFDHLAVTVGDWGGPMFIPFPQLEISQLQGAFAVRFWGAITVAKHAVSKLAPQGSITLTSGVLSQQPKKGLLPFAVIAGATEHLASSLAIDLAPIRVNVVSPGFVLTEMNKQMPAEMQPKFIGPIPLERGGTPEEIASAYVHLMLSSYITGITVPVNGGVSFL